jgi:uncharacterized membrane protein YgcG
MFRWELQPTDEMPLGWLFWLFTICIPIAYLLIGLLRKDFILIRVGLCLLAAILVTARYYHEFLPVETIMAICGIVLLAIAYWLTKYFRVPRHGFTADSITGENKHIESLIIAQTFTRETGNADNRFGGGSFGGGGSSGNF